MIELELTKGFNLNLYGDSEELFVQAPFPEKAALKPADYIGIKPKVSVATGDKVKVGSELFFDKERPDIVFTSPVSGNVKDIIRGDRRALQAIVIETDGKQSSKTFKFSNKNINRLKRNEIITVLLKSGLFPCFIQRPFAKVANPTDIPRDIFISAFNSAPLAPDANMIVFGHEEEFKTGINIISKINSGKVYLAVDRDNSGNSSAYLDAPKTELIKVAGPHPAGNVGVHIHHTAPIKNKHDIVWTCSVQAVIWIGRLFSSGKLSFDTTISVAGSSAKGRAYYKTVAGAEIKSIISRQTPVERTRFISGDVLTGKKTDYDGFAGFYDNMITVIPEPDMESFEFLGWAKPGFEKFSKSMTYLSNFIRFGNKFIQSATTNGSRRSFIATGIYEEVLPMDIYPIFLLKSIYGSDVEEMEGLGIYEVAEEDLALCEYIDPSKNDIQELLRQGLDLADKEG